MAGPSLDGGEGRVKAGAAPPHPRWGTAPRASARERMQRHAAFLVGLRAGSGEWLVTVSALFAAACGLGPWVSQPQTCGCWVFSAGSVRGSPGEEGGSALRPPREQPLGALPA